MCPITVLDYVEPGNWAEAEKTAQQIVKLGFMPWVANGDLTWLGQGRLRLAPRKVLAIVNGTPAQQMDHELFRHAAMPLEYLGWRWTIGTSISSPCPSSRLSAAMLASSHGWMKTAVRRE